MQTEDQNFDAHFEALEPPLSDVDYMFSLEQGEGISDLFDAFDVDIWTCILLIIPDCYHERLDGHP